MKCPHCGREHPDNARFCPTTGQRIEGAAGPDPAAEGRVKTVSLVLLVLALLPLAAQFSVVGVGEVSALGIWDAMVRMGNYASDMGSSLGSAYGAIMFFMFLYFVLWVLLIVRAARSCYLAFQGERVEGATVVGACVISAGLALVPIVGSMVVNGMVSSAISDGVSYLSGGSYSFAPAIEVCSATEVAWIQLIVSVVMFFFVRSSNASGARE